MIQRISKLIDDGLAPGAEILVLTFTRAAASVIKKRIQEANNKVNFVKASTFDSFASEQLFHNDPSISWNTKDYDKRIEEFIALLESDKTHQLKSSVRHILIDEIQDLVGIRARMVISLLENIPCGFSLFGDPAQGIYDFQEKTQSKPFLFSDFHQNLSSSFNKLSLFTLNQNFRIDSANNPTIFKAGQSLNAQNPNYKNIYDDLIEQLKYKTKSISPALFLLQPGTKAILAHNNLEVLMISDKLYALGIEHKVLLRDNPEPTDPWLGTFLRPLKSKFIRQESFAEQLSNIKTSRSKTIPDPKQAWRTLRIIANSSEDVLKIADIHRTINEDRIPDELISNHEVLTVSTVHKAKGLEFNHVMVFPAATKKEPDAKNVPDETRVLFVAMTRHRNTLFRGTFCSFEDRQNWWQHPYENRFVMHSFLGGNHLIRGAKNPTTIGIEIRNTDIRSDIPAGFSEKDEISPADIQDFMIENLLPGDLVDMHFYPSIDEKWPVCKIRHRETGTLIGSANDQFLSYLYDRLDKYRIFRKHASIKWPESITNLRVETVDTVAGNYTSSLPEGFGTTGIWNSVRIFGLGIINYR